MRRTQLYLQEHLWKLLHIHSRQQRTTVSELVRQAVEEKYGAALEERRQAMEALVGLRKGRPGLPDTETYIRKLRKGKRQQRLAS